ncbi:hypothetical protein [Bifidobacterium aquikefiricola]|uniref:Uncharacterized protein n=1 Tax=Bifidobacterium aquikefiricola TaxID=3059038 RepID=A0AB39U5B6_9BIFI
MGYRYFTIVVHSEFPASVTLDWEGSPFTRPARDYASHIKVEDNPFMNRMVDSRRLTIDLKKEGQLTGTARVTCTCRLIRPGNATASIEFDYDASSNDTFKCILKDHCSGISIEQF